MMIIVEEDHDDVDDGEGMRVKRRGRIATTTKRNDREHLFVHNINIITTTTTMMMVMIMIRMQKRSFVRTFAKEIYLFRNGTKTEENRRRHAENRRRLLRPLLSLSLKHVNLHVHKPRKSYGLFANAKRSY